MMDIAGPQRRGEAADHRRQMAKLIERLPKPVGRAAAWLLRPESRCLRVPLGVALVLGSLFSFLPILGLWMLPLGALFLAEDFPLIRRPTTRAIDAVERWWARRNWLRATAGQAKAWIEHRRPHWLGLPPVPRRHFATSEKETH